MRYRALAAACALTCTLAVPAYAVDLAASTPLGVSPPAGLFYAYAPSVIDQGTTRRVFYCGNSASGSVHDHVMVSTGVKQANGTWSYGAPKVAFGPEGAPVWANYHACDPEALKGAFTWGGHTYPWVIFFTAFGCASTTEPCPDADTYPNQVGMAFADSLDGPWRIYPTPLIGYDLDFGGKCAAGDYCVGQPSATSINGAGHMLLFYQGKGGDVRRDVDLSDVANPVIGPSVALPSDGLPGWMHNASVVYSPSRDRFFASYAVGPWNVVPGGPPVQTSTAVVSIAGSDLWAGTGAWQVEGTVTPATSGHAFNHNSGIVRTAFGMLPSDTLEVVHAVADGHTPDGGWGVWTYRLWRNTITLPAP